MKGTWWIAPAIAVAVLSFFVLLSPVGLLTAAGMTTIGIFLFTVILWVFVGIGYPSLLCIALIAALGIMTPEAEARGS
ncbi:MAG: hypothetical protein Q8Q07_02095 [Dehalococcoidales bacterium]|nr:hypothetical protein [Dehalococcoidales bacterium]